MRRSVFLLAAFTTCLASPAAAAAGTASFGCEARKPAVCYFRIFYYPRFNRQIVLPAGMKTTVPGLDIGRDRYCVSIGKPPRHPCARKPISADYNY
jgi:hypothetical protein